MKNLLFVWLVFPILLGMEATNVTSEQTYSCPKCHTTLKHGSRSEWHTTKEPCYYCKGDGKTDDVDSNGRVIKNCRTCDVCDGTGKKLELVTVQFLYCPNGHGEFAYPD